MIPFTVYGDLRSGNCYKVALLLELLGRPYHWHHVDILAGETGTREFLALNRTGKIPVLALAQDQNLAESNAILNFLAQDTAWLPNGALPRARVLQWQFFEQYSHEPFIAVARYINLYLGRPAEREAEYRAKQEGGHRALAVMEQALQEQQFLVGDSPTIADISLYAYTHVAHEGGFDLSPYPAISRWIQAMGALPGYTGMTGPFPHRAD